MKKAIVAAAALLAVSAQASSDLEFGDLNYFLKSNQLNLTTDINVVDVEEQPDNETEFTEIQGYTVENRLSYGIADNLNAFVGVDFAFQLEIDQKGADSGDINGFGNPYVGANYRLMNQKDASFNLDFGALARFSLMDAELGAPNEDGTFNKGHNTVDLFDPRGNHSLEVNSSIGNKWNEANEWRVTAAVMQNFEGEVDFREADEDADTTASTDFSLTGAYQYRPVQEFMMAVSLQALRVGERDLETSAGDITNDAHLDWHFRFSAKYLITEKFIAKFNYGISRLEEYDREISGTDVEVRDRQANFYGVGIDWLF